MLDARARSLLGPALDSGARRLRAMGVTPDALTVVGFAIGLAAIAAAALAAWWLALALWLLNRLVDGMDGALARLQRPTDLGGFLDIVADFAVYGGFVAGVAIGAPDARVAALAVLVAYYVNGTAFLALSSISQRRQVVDADGRSLHFVGGLTEGTETVIAHGLFCVVAALALTALPALLWVWAAMVAISALQRIVFAVRRLRD